jgi:hypothetical protein
MADLDDRFRGFSREPAPDLWVDIQERTPRPPSPGPSLPRRVGVITVALAVTAGAFAFGLTALSTDRHGPSLGDSGPIPMANGAIYVSVGGGDGPFWWESVHADGSGRERVFGPDAAVRRDRIAWSPDGSRMAFRFALVGHFGIYTSNADGSDVRQLTDGVNDSWPSWSPDGLQVVFSSTRADPTVGGCTPGDDGGCPTDLYVMEADGSNVTRLTDDPGAEFAPAWSPEGSEIAYVHAGGPGSPGPGLSWTIRRVDPDGADDGPIASTPEGSNFQPTWSPDGTRLAYGSIRGEEWWVFTASAGGGDEHVVAGATLADDPGAMWSVEDVSWSPDGSWIAFTGLASPGIGSSLFLARPDGSERHEVASDEYGLGQIAWRPSPDAGLASPANVQSTLSTTHDVGGYPNAIAVGEGGIWVSAPARNGQDYGGDVVRLDPRTGEVVARIAVDALPGWEFGGGGLAVGEGAVWVMGVRPSEDSCCSVVVSRIDPETNSVTDRIDLAPDGGEGDIWVDGSGIWAVYASEATADDIGQELTVVHVDPTTSEILARFRVPGEWSQTIFAADGSIWVTALVPGSDGSYGGSGGQTLFDRIDPPTHAVTMTSCTDCLYSDVALSWPAFPWASLDGGVQRLDPITGRPLGSRVLLSSDCCGTGPFLADGRGGAWVTDVEGGTTGRSVWHLDAAGVIDAIGPIPAEGSDLWQGVAYAFDPATNAIWVVHYRNSVSRIQLSSG